MSATRTAPSIAPYWTRLPSFLLYPFSVEPLLVSCGLALLTSFAALLFTPANAIASFLVFIGLMRYGFYVLERTGRGHIDDTKILFDSVHGGKYLPYKQLAVILVAVTLCGFAASIAGPNAAWVSLALFAALWPANTMVLALGNDLGESLNPARLWELASRIGMPYLGLCACLLLLFFGGGFLQASLTKLVPRILVVPVGSLALCLSTIAMFRMMGYVLYQYHHELGHAVQVGFEAQAGGLPTTDTRTARAGRIAELLREGKSAEALAEARGAANDAPADHDAQARLHRLLCALPDQDGALFEHARRWLPALLRSQRNSQALEVFETLSGRDAAFLPKDAADRIALAEAAFAAHRPATATRLIRGFDKQYPGHREIPSVYLLGARLLLEHHRDDAQAERVLEALRTHFPQHPAAGEAEKLLALAARLKEVGATR